MHIWQCVNICKPIPNNLLFICKSMRRLIHKSCGFMVETDIHHECSDASLPPTRLLECTVSIWQGGEGRGGCRETVRDVNAQGSIPVHVHVVQEREREPGGSCNINQAGAATLHWRLRVWSICRASPEAASDGETKGGKKGGRLVVKPSEKTKRWGTKGRDCAEQVGERSEGRGNVA